MRAFAFCIALFQFAGPLVIAAAAFAPTPAQAQQTGGYLPPNVGRSSSSAVPAAAGVPTAPYPSTATSGAAAAQIRLIEPENSPKVSGAAEAKQSPEPDRDATQPDPRLQSRGPAGTAPLDPTVPGPDIQRLLDAAGGNRNAPAGPPPLPEMRLRARIFAKNKPPVAVIDVGGRPLSVRIGSEIQFSTAGGVMKLKVVELTTSELQIEVVGRNGQFIVLN